MTFPKESEQIKDIIIISVPESPTVEDTREKALDSLLLLRPICPERDSVKEAVLQSMNAGVRIIMITIDYFKTATVISKNTDGGGCLEVVGVDQRQSPAILNARCSNNGDAQSPEAATAGVGPAGGDVQGHASCSTIASNSNPHC